MVLFFSLLSHGLILDKDLIYTHEILKIIQPMTSYQLASDVIGIKLYKINKPMRWNYVLRFDYVTVATFISDSNSNAPYASGNIRKIRNATTFGTGLCGIFCELIISISKLNLLKERIMVFVI